ncbi:PAS domain-containing protein [Microvirga pudoricolor]|uniref:PAS domain-containing protein n=1 Tax=Microvirga pudoricolor TaxID=2778729 RepID=UPI00194F36DB|nr:PAS domain-containing protein [Microvirga pudoricolor]MBM6594551.1 PAS domain-containing protein [Microvirga pudoricolor]
MLRLSSKNAIDFGELFNNSPNPYVLLSPDFAIVGMNDAYLRVTMRKREDIIGRNMFDAFPGTPDERGLANVTQLRSSLDRVVETGEADHLPLIEYAIARPEGGFEERYWSATHTPVLKEGQVTFILQHTVDVTELHRLRQSATMSGRAAGASALVEGDILRRAEAVQHANEVLKEERQHLRRLFEQAPGFTAVLSGPSHVFEMANPAYLDLIGRRNVIGKTVGEALPEIPNQGFITLLDQVYATGQPYVGRRIPVQLGQRPGASPVERFLDFVYQPILSPEGRTVGILVQGNDITDQKRAEDELREYREQLERLVLARTRALEESESQRRQAQKMEAVGQLTGGVAHDFNNLLAIVIGNVELARRRVSDPRLERLLDNALMAGERGAKLTRQLLAFARKQSLSLEPTELSQTIEGMQDLLARTIGPSIVIRTQLPQDLWPVVTDRNQLEVAILNLAINARDAMPNGGTLTIGASNVPPDELPEDLTAGEYVRIAVRDTGSGIPEELRAKVFEPFFTTKDVGKGTGLGLSQIYGFVKQQGGSVTLNSTLGKGTEVSLFLPRAESAPVAEIAERPDGPRQNIQADILVVDDDDGVRMLVVESLTDAGYRVQEARNGSDGLGILRRRDDIDLVIVDFAMPVLDGLGFIEAARLERPDLPIVMMTGYADAERLTEDRLGDIPLVAKPFKLETLLTALRQRLASSAPATPRRAGAGRT